MITRCKNFSFFALMLLALMTGSCQSSGSAQEGFEDLTVAEFQQKMDEGNAIVLDVRTPEETAAGIVPGAKEIDFRGDGFKEKLEALDKDETYLVYCKSGGRSSSACSMMEEMGFKKVYNLVGGYTAWSAEK
jgi:rhodanese-related sulfurtransferase